MKHQAGSELPTLVLLAIAATGALACMPAGKNVGGSGGSGGIGVPATGGSGGGGGSEPGASGGSGGATGGSGASGGETGSPAPADAGGGSSGSDASGPGPEAGGGVILPGVHKVVLLMGDPNTKDLSRSQMVEILNSMKGSHGVTVQVMDSQMATAAALMDASLIIAGPNNNYCIDTPDPGFKTLPVPIMVSRDCKTTAIGLGTMLNTQEYVTGLPVKINIVKTDHPLAANLSGVTPVLETRCRLVRGSKLGPDAIKIARAPDDATPPDPDSWAIFAYEKGGMMPGGIKAPAKRIGFFWHRPSAVTPEGRKLFEAAIDWALRP